MSSRSLSICLLTLALTSLATAQPAVTTAPATTQASVKADQTTPRGALKSLTVAMNKGDAAGIKSVFNPTGDVENKMVDAVVNLPSPCLAPAVFFTTGTDRWLAVTGF